MITYDKNRPWLTLDDWQKEYIFETDPDENCFLLTGRQVGKTTAMSIKAVELCVKHYKKGEFVLINSITEKQAYHMLAKAIVYAKENHFSRIVWKGDNKPTKHKLMFKNGTGILCYAAGETGEGLRGYTIKKLMADEGSRMSEDYFVAVLPSLSVINGSMDIASTPFMKKHKDGTEKFFYKCSKDKKFRKFYASGEDCPRHSKEFLEDMKGRLTKLAYAQEFLAVFTDELQRLFDDELINKIFVLKRDGNISKSSRYYMGCDIAGFGKSECTYEVLEKTPDGMIFQKESIAENRKYTTDTTRKIISLSKIYPFGKDSIGIDDGGIGFGVYSELMDNDSTKRKTIPLNNSSRPIDREGKKSKRLLKEEMYMNLISLMENNKIKLLDDDELKASFASIQHEEGKIFSFNAHHAEGVIRGVWLASKDKHLKLWIDSIKA